MNWTTAEIRYLEDHAHEGAEAVAEALGRSVGSVRVQASRYGVSLSRRWRCPRCGAVTRRPPSPVTGWCENCTKEERRRRIEDEVRELEAEAERAERENRERQRLYARRHRAKKKIKSMKQR